MIPESIIQGQDGVDHLEEMMKKTGCMERLSLVQECIVETQDWRKCQKQVKEFRSCMDEYQRKMGTSLNA